MACLALSAVVLLICPERRKGDEEIDCATSQIDQLIIPVSLCVHTRMELSLLLSRLGVFRHGIRTDHMNVP